MTEIEKGLDPAIKLAVQEPVGRVVGTDPSTGAIRFAGTNKNDAIQGTGTADIINTFAGSDIAFGHGGDDIISGGRGKDIVSGGDGQDALYGGDAAVFRTTSNTTTLSGGKDLSISLTLPDAHNGDTIDISGFLSREPIRSEDLDLVFVIDVSGSTQNAFQGTVSVGDLNGDGRSDTILDAEIAAFEALHRSIVRDAQLPDASITLVSFSDDATRSQTFRANADNNRNGIADVIEEARSFQDGGQTNFEAALQKSLQFFRSVDQSQKALYFLSDGGKNDGGAFDDEVRKLLNLDVSIQSFGIGQNASEASLDIVDDNINNDSTTIVLDPDKLQETLLDPGIGRGVVEKIEVLVNGKVAGEIPKNALVTTPFGLRYFESTIEGLRPNNGDTVTLRVTAADSGKTVISTSQRVEPINTPDGDDTLMGDNGRDKLYGGAGADKLIGGAGRDLLDGGFGRDIASYVDAPSGVTVNLNKPAENTGFANGDTYRSIEVIEGSQFRDKVFGDATSNIFKGIGGNDLLSGLRGADILEGQNGNDQLLGGRGNDILRGGTGNDRLSGGLGRDQLFGGTGQDILNGGKQNDVLAGGAGPDTFVFAGADGRNRITDFQDGIDAIEITAGAIRFAQLDIDRVQGGTEVSFGQTEIFLKGVTPNQLSGADFDFT